MIYSKESLRIQTFNAIEKGILEGTYQAGENLREQWLSKELGVSRTPIREALMQLEREGLVQNIPNKGAVVIGISYQDVEDIYEIRARIEGLAARLCAGKATERELTQMEQSVVLQEYYMMKNEAAKMGEQDGEFHRILFAASKSRQLQAVLTGFHNSIQRARALSVRSKMRAEESVAEHKAILQAISQKDGELAEQLMTKHIQNAKRQLKRVEAEL